MFFCANKQLKKNLNFFRIVLKKKKKKKKEKEINIYNRNSLFVATQFLHKTIICNLRIMQNQLNFYLISLLYLYIFSIIVVVIIFYSQIRIL